METLKNLGAAVLGLSFFAVLGIAAAFYIHAASIGLDEGFGWDGWWVVALLILMVTMRIGLFVVVLSGAYGAFYGWQWEWWAVLLVFFPFIVLSVAGGLVAALYGTMQMALGRFQKSNTP